MNENTYKPEVGQPLNQVLPTEYIIPKPGDRFKHFKQGGIYKIITIFIWEPTKEPAVLYQCEDTGEQWGRPLSVFMSKVPDPIDPSVQVWRFKLCENEALPSESKSQ